MAPRKARRRGRVTYREVVREYEGVLQVGDPRPHGRAVSLAQIRQLAQITAQTWPTARTLTVAIFARWPWDEPEPEEGYRGFSEAKQEESYGRILAAVSATRHYYGWRSRSVSRSFFTETPNLVVRGIVEGYEGRTPIRCVSVRRES
ncbi:MAG: hypothetical protein M0T72_11315 [Candidatus Dormibacteraeota bacterium]|nr:hypothetical protein [Candidatus Dormibacteraeota bacterium]